MEITETTFFGIDYIGEEEEIKKINNIIWTSDESIFKRIEENKKDSERLDNYILWDDRLMAKNLIKAIQF